MEYAQGKSSSSTTYPSIEFIPPGFSYPTYYNYTTLMSSLSGDSGGSSESGPAGPGQPPSTTGQLPPPPPPGLPSGVPVMGLPASSTGHPPSLPHMGSALAVANNGLINHNHAGSSAMGSAESLTTMSTGFGDTVDHPQHYQQMGTYPYYDPTSGMTSYTYGGDGRYMTSMSYGTGGALGSSGRENMMYDPSPVIPHNNGGSLGFVNSNSYYHDATAAPVPKNSATLGRHGEKRRGNGGKQGGSKKRSKSAVGSGTKGGSNRQSHHQYMPPPGMENDVELMKKPNGPAPDPFAAEAIVPLPYQMGDDFGYFGPAAVWKRNERERLRVRSVNDGYERLRRALPLTGRFKDKRISKVETLRLACRYITHLQLLLTDPRHDDVCECVLHPRNTEDCMGLMDGVDGTGMFLMGGCVGGEDERDLPLDVEPRHEREPPPPPPPTSTMSLQLQRRSETEDGAGAADQERQPTHSVVDQDQPSPELMMGDGGRLEMVGTQPEQEQRHIGYPVGATSLTRSCDSV